MSYIYKVRQLFKEEHDNWVAANNIKVGDKVKLLYMDEPPGWEDVFMEEMEKEVGSVGRVLEINKTDIKVKFNDSTWNYPFTCLQKIEDDRFLIIQKTSGNFYAYFETESHYNRVEDKRAKDCKRLDKSVLDNECNLSISLDDETYIVIDLKESN